MRIAICDDETYYLDKVEELIQKYFENHSIQNYKIDKYCSGKKLCECMETMEPYDILFLDINMENMTGIETAKIFRQYSPDNFLVFITAFIDYAIEGYHVDAVRYILKNRLEEAFIECMDCIMEKSVISRLNLEYRFREGKRKVQAGKLLYIESHQHLLFFNMEDSTQFTLYEKLDNIETDLKKCRFLRIHKSFLVNSKYINRICNYKVFLLNGESLPIPREKYHAVKEAYYQMRGDL